MSESRPQAASSYRNVLKSETGKIFSSVLVTIITTFVVSQIQPIQALLLQPITTNLFVVILALVAANLIAVFATRFVLRRQFKVSQRQYEEKIKRAAEEHQAQINSVTTNYEEKIRLLMAKLEETTDTSNRDLLTGAYNSNQIMPILGKRIEEAQAKLDTFVLILADIDGFKRINDTYTHEVGNSVLTQLAEVITPRSPGDVLIRYGGDEFLIITKLGVHATPSGYGFAERLRREVSEFSFLVGENSAKREKLTMSFGITEYVPGQDDAKSIRRRVAEALHRAKQPREDGQSKNFSYPLRLEDLS